jgi:hypothetical protein
MPVIAPQVEEFPVVRPKLNHYPVDTDVPYVTVFISQLALCFGPKLVGTVQVLDDLNRQFHQLFHGGPPFLA